MTPGIWKQVLLGTIMMACFETPLHGQRELPTITPFELGYSIRNWTMDDGLKGPYIGAFVQARDGSLLFSDSEGLIRYNGIRFENVIEDAGPDVPRRQILSIHEDASGRLWTAGLTGQAMRERDGRWVPLGAGRGGYRGVGKFAQGPDGRLWCAVNAGGRGLMVNVWGDGRFQPALKEPVPAGYVQQLEFDPSGQLWLSVASSGSRPFIYRLENDTLVPGSDPAWGTGTLFRKDGDPRLWLATSQGIRVREGDAWNEVLAFSSALPDRGGFSACVTDRDGNYWIATRRLGIWVCQPDGRLSRLVSEEVKFPNLIRDLFIGRDGTMWFNGENGLLQLRRQPFTLWPQDQRNRHATVRAMAEDSNGTLWFGGIGIYSLQPGEFVRSHWQDDTAIPSVYGMLGHPDGGAWFASSGGGLSFISHAEQRPVGGPLRNSGQLVDLAYHDGAPWCGLSKNLVRLEERRLVPDRPEGSPMDSISCLAEGREGELYAGFRAQGLFRRKDGQWTFTGLPGLITAIAVAPDNGVWVLRAAGELCWLRDGQWHHASTTAMGLPPTFQMVCASDGSIWFQPFQGPVVRINRTAAESWMQGNRIVDLQRRTYGREEGLPAEQAPYGPRKSTIMEDSRGRIWVATVLGTCAWLPSYDARNAADTSRDEPMPVLIETVVIDDQPVAGRNGSLTVAPHQHRLEVHYTGLDLASPERVTYRYRVEGYEDEWIDVGNRNVAYLQRMPPGSYRFQVVAADRHGVWNEEGASVAITVLPHWWEHGLFRFGASAVGLLLLLGVICLRGRSFQRHALERARLQDEFSRGLIEVQESERARIAGDLHDDLGQDLLVMKSRIDLARRRSESEAEKATLQEMSESAAHVLHKTRSLSHQLRPLHLDHLGLAASVKSLVKEVAGAAKLDYEVEADDLEEQLSSGAKVATYRMLQESLNNVIKHAEADSVKVQLRRHDHHASLIISDDGRGFEGGAERPSSEGAGHGLRAMKERCVLLGGSIKVISAPGEGTLIRIEVPWEENTP